MFHVLLIRFSLFAFTLFAPLLFAIIDVDCHAAMLIPVIAISAPPFSFADISSIFFADADSHFFRHDTLFDMRFFISFLLFFFRFLLIDDYIMLMPIYIFSSYYSCRLLRC